MTDKEKKQIIKAIAAKEQLMTEKETRQVIKAFSFWKVNSAKNNYRLPNGDTCKKYIEDLIWHLMDRMSLVVMNYCLVDGIYCEKTNTYKAIIPAHNDIVFTFDEMERNVKNLASSFFRD